MVFKDGPVQTNYEFNVGIVDSCISSDKFTVVEGTTSKNGTLVNGEFVVVSTEADGPIFMKIESGPHNGYPGWPDGYFSHILYAGSAQEGE